MKIKTNNTEFETVCTEDLYAIISRKEYLDIENNIPKKDLVLISISEPTESGWKNTELSDESVQDFKDSLRIKFWDVEDDIGQYEVIPDDTAKIIQDFIIKNKDQKFLVHCRAGQSRSAAVGRAIECIKHFGIGDEAKFSYKTCFNSEILNYERYSPNYAVFNKIIKEYE